jgi:hypothetical protein
MEPDRSVRNQHAGGQDLPAAPSPRPLRLWEFIAVAVILAVHLAYAAAFIERSSFTIGSQRYYCLFDDAVISMEYAKNWALGYGPVWNEGERVEGYTNFLWVFVMMLVHRLGLDPSANCLLMQRIGEGLLLTNVLLTWLLGWVCGLSPPGRVLAAVLVSSHYVTNFWGLEGMETAPLACVVSVGLIFACRALRRGATSSTGLLILGICPLLRPDSVLVLGTVALWMFISCRRQRFLTALVAGLALVPLVLHVLWRHSYYGEWLPNTYYLKATGLPILTRLLDGINFTWFSLARSFALWSVVAAGLFFGPSRPVGLFVSCFGVILAYQVWVGGDAWQRDRFVLPVLPGLMVGASYYVIRALSSWARSPGWRAAGAVLVAALAILNFNYSFFKEWLLIRPPHFTTENETNVRRALAIKELTDQDATIAVSWAGAPPYFADRRGVDLLGKSDAHIARLPADPSRHIPGHNKVDVAYSLDHYKPDVIAAEYLDIFVGEPAFSLYNRFYFEFAGRQTFFWVRYDTDKVQTFRMSRTPLARTLETE